MQQEFFPREVTSDAPRMTLTGSGRLLVEQHKGLLDCQAEGISMRTAAGILAIGGEELILMRYTKDEALVVGRIFSLTLQPEGRRT